MRRALIISVTAHVALAAVGYVGLPALRAETPLVEDTLIVDIVMVDEETNVPTARPEPEPPKKAETPPPPPPTPDTAAPPPPPQVAARPLEPEPEPEPPPPPIPKPEAKPKPKPEAKPKPKPEAKPKPAAKPKPPQRLARVTLRRKPKPPDPFASVLRTVEALKKRPSAPTKEKKVEKKKPPQSTEDFKTQMARAIRAGARTFDASRPLTASQIDLVRQQISNCWNIQAGSKDAEDLIIEIHIDMNPDGFVRSAKIVDSARVGSDHFFRSAAETALRAVLNKRCQPFKLPRDRYDQWQIITMTFDPREMF